jgi:hypothetical protein
MAGPTFVESVFVSRMIETMAGNIARSAPFRATLLSTMSVGKILNGRSMKQKMAVIGNAMIKGHIIEFVAEVDYASIVRSAEALVHGVRDVIWAEMIARKWQKLGFFEGFSALERREVPAVGELADDLL